MRTHVDIRQALTARLGAIAVTDRIWSYLVTEEHVAAVEHGERDVGWLVERVERLLEASGQWERALKPKPQMLATSSIGDRMALFSLLVAKEADNRDDVKAYRQTVLDGQLLSPEQVEPWIMEREPKNGPGGGMRIAIEAPDTIEYDARHPFRLKVPLTVRETLGSEWPQLDFVTPDSRYVKSMTTPAATGPLARLRMMSEELARTYDWFPAQATVFVLTGQAPLLPSFRWSITNHHWPGPRRIALDIDLILSPRDVARRYAEVRRRLRPPRSRSRELSARHLALAAFIAVRRDGEPWGKRLRAWNTEQPKWRYGHESNFRRDALRATERIRAPVVTSDAVGRALWQDEDTQAPAAMPRRSVRRPKKGDPR
jgi:hypothetical protein